MCHNLSVMNIAQSLEKIKSRQGEILTGLILVLGLSLAFGLGRWSNLGSVQNSIRVENIPPKSTEANSAIVSKISPETEGVGGNFVASRNGKKYYPADCKSANRIKAENRIYFRTAAEAEAAGYTLTTTCQ